MRLNIDAHPSAYLAAILGIAVVIFLTTSCGTPDRSGEPLANPDALPGRIILDFEQPDPPVVWIPTAGIRPTETAGTGAETVPGILQRGSQRPHAGLWTLNATAADSGTIQYTPPEPINLSDYDVLCAQVAHLETAERSGQYSAALAVSDTEGRTIQGDYIPVLGQWHAVPLDLGDAVEAGLDLSRVASIGLKLLRHGTHEAAVCVQTDSWTAQPLRKQYLGDRFGPARSFYVEHRGTRLRVGAVDLYELTLVERGLTADGKPGSWLEVVNGTEGRKALGQPATGLMLLDRSRMEALSSIRRTTPDGELSATTAGEARPLPGDSWPFSPDVPTHIRWEVVWTSPIAAVIEGTQQYGPYDRLQEPAFALKWRLMIYQWGQVFVTARWTRSAEIAPQGILIDEPVSWALVLDESGRPRPGGAQGQPSGVGDPTERLLAEIYPPILRQGLKTALPHQTQTGAPVALVARTTPEKDSWWWAQGRLTPGDGPPRRYIGAGIPPVDRPASMTGWADCMLLVLEADPLTKAVTFGQYLVPPRVVLRQGELDRRVPGDEDQDGFVESYGFQAIRLANGRASFTVYPQDRPIFYPPYLFTVPAVERETMDLSQWRLLINIDGKQFADPPRFPDGSFLLQVPYKLDRPVSVEAILVRR